MYYNTLVFKVLCHFINSYIYLPLPSCHSSNRPQCAGKPGCGKTSLVTALAGELKLPIYMLSLATPGLSDTSLLDLLNRAPAHMILLLEDIDAVFDGALKNDEKKKNNEVEEPDEVEEMGGGGFGRRRGFGSQAQAIQHKRQMAGKVLISFAGILNAVDGVAAQTGRLLFMTTNHKEKLDSALIRPGRIDYQVQFSEATRGQIKALFFNFYKPVKHVGDGLLDVDVDVSVCSEESRLAALAAAERTLTLLGERFSALVPEGRYTMAQVQGVFMRYREDPGDMLKHLQEELDKIDQNGEAEDETIPSLSRQLSGKSKSSDRGSGSGATEVDTDREVDTRIEDAVPNLFSDSMSAGLHSQRPPQHAQK
jgi:chaperone BCS1